MLFDDTFRWSEPRSWPSIIYVWLALVAAGWIWAAWKKLRPRGAPDWPATDGNVTATDVTLPKNSFFSQPRNQQPYKAEFSYSYSVAGVSYSGRYKGDFPTEGEAREFIRDLVGQRLRVQYHPEKAQKSSIAMETLQSVLQHRAPRLGRDPLVTFSAPLPGWIRPFAWFFLGLSAVGLLFSLWVHINAVLGRQVLPDGFMFVHAGIFVVWLPAILAAQRLTNQSQFRWKLVLRGAPSWMRYVAYAFFAYAIINFLLFMTQPSNQGSGNRESISMWRGFSGHWMVFYSMSLAILYSAVRIRDMRVRCAKGHWVSDTARCCAECGRPVSAD